MGLKAKKYQKTYPKFLLCDVLFIFKTYLNEPMFRELLHASGLLEGRVGFAAASCAQRVWLLQQQRQQQHIHFSQQQQQHLRQHQRMQVRCKG